jgi:hypothetical protein
VGSAAILVVGTLAGGGAWWMGHRGPGRPSIGGAVGRFRSSSGSRTGTAAVRPAPGVYVYAGTGDEHLSFMSTSQSQDGNLPGTVTLGPGGCWALSVEYNSFHRQGWSFCSTGGRLTERANTTDQKFDFGPLSQSEHTEVVCNPPMTVADPANAPGDHDPVRCTGHSQTTKADMTQRGRVTTLGRTTVEVGNRRVEAIHVVKDITISGDQKGSDHEEIWIATRTGLPVREQRSTRVESPAPAPLHHVTYTEHGSWRLTSMTPRT